MLLVKLLLAHLLGDFLLQPGAWVKNKEAKKIRSPYLYFHVTLHMLLPFLLIGKVNFWWMAILIGITHYVIDVMKLYFQNQSTQRTWFLVDQSLHLAVILIVWYVVAKPSLDTKGLFDFDFYIIVTSLYFITHPAAIFIKVIISRWEPNAGDDMGKVHETGNTSLQDAGKYIGMLERLFVFVFILMGQWQSIGFLIAAKSVFRFGDLKDSDGRKLTEYVLIGTLTSFGMAIATGLVVKYFISQTG